MVRTITDVFPSCRVFRESPPAADLREGDPDFTNMVIFCKKTEGELTFRRAGEPDFLQTHSRRQYLQPQHEVGLGAFLADRSDPADRRSRDEGAGILRGNETEKLAQWHTASAMGHWGIMRTVLPDRVWEQW